MSPASRSRSNSTTAGEKRHVGAGEGGQADGVHILLDGGLHDLGRGLVEARIDDLVPRVPERPGHHLGAPVVAVQAGLGNQDTSGHAMLGHLQFPEAAARARFRSMSSTISRKEAAKLLTPSRSSLAATSS